MKQSWTCEFMGAMPSNV